MTASPPLSAGSERSRRIAAVLILVLIGAVLPALSLRAVWLQGPDQVSEASNKLPEWDFANLWAGGTLASQGETAVLFDVGAYRRWFLDHVGADGASREWSYPPSMLLVSVPLAQLPLLASYLLWTAGTLLLLYLVLAWSGVSRLAALVTVLSPGALNNVVFGQTGALTASLLLGALLLAGRRPVQGGMLAGLLTVKPQFGVLLPVCFVAARYWRAIAAAAAAALFLVLATSALFGWDVYPLFFTQTAPLMRSIMEADFPQPYHANAVTVFLSMRALGAGLGLAYAIQGIAAAICCLLCWRMWRAPVADPHLRVAATACLALLATPYGYTYDMVVLSFAAAVLLERSGWRLRPLLLLCWLWPSLAVFASTNVFPVAPAVVVLAVGLCWRSLGTDASAVAVTSRRGRSR